MNKNVSVWAKGIAGGYEALLAVPILGGSIVMLSGWQALSLAFTLHFVVLIISFLSKTSPVPSIIGLITSVLAYVPVLGWLLHTITAIFYIVSAVKDRKNEKKEKMLLSE